MYVCSDGHEEIAHEDRNCPVCVIVEERDKLKDEVSDLQGKLEDAYGTIERLQEETGEI